MKHFNNSTAIAVVDDTINFVSVKYLDDTRDLTWVYKTRLDVKEGSTVVVQRREGLALAEIVGLYEEPEWSGNITYKWIVQVVDMVAHNRNLEEEKHIIKAINTSRLKSSRRALAEEMFGTEGIPDNLKIEGETK